MESHELTIALEMEIASLDPLYGTAMQHDRNILNLFYENLFYMSETGAFLPALAERWEQSPDGLTISISLRPNVFFHNGEKLDAAAVKDSLERSQRSNILTRSSVMLNALSHVEVKNELDLDIVLKRVDPTIMAALSSEAGMIVAPAISAQPVPAHRAPIGTGPFLFEEWSGGLRVVALRNPDYWNLDEGEKSEGTISKITVLFAPNATVKINGALAGEIDLADNVQIRDHQRLKRSSMVRLQEAPTSVSYYVSLNNKRPPFDDARVRRALAAAIDRTGVNTIVSRGRAVVNPTWVPAKSGAFNETLSPVSTDQSGAARNFTAQGIDRLRLTVIQREPDVLIAQVLQAQLGEVGVKLDIEVLERQSWLSKILSGNYQLATLRTIVPRPDPDFNFSAYYARDARANYSSIEDNRIFDLVDLARSTLSQNDRSAAYREIQKILVGEAYQVFLITQPNFDLMASNLVGVEYEFGGAWRLGGARFLNTDLVGQAS